MIWQKLFPILFLFLFCSRITTKSQDIYFPPNDGSTWDTLSFKELNWNEEKLPELFEFLDSNNTKAFLVLKDGKIVIEKYFGSFNKDSLWYWASAGKTLTSALVGIAQAEGYLSINEKTNKYLGEGWTSCPNEKENLITIWHQLTMTSGLDDKVNDPYCTLPECLIFKADAGTRWAYHNAPYTLLDSVIEVATKTKFWLYFNTKLRNRIGMNGLWFKSGFNNVYISNARSMARFGLLILNKGVWDKQRIIPENYFNEMINTSQELNKSYGYLFWLNGKESFMLPQTQFVFSGSLMRDAPEDVVAALGKNGQIINVSFQHSIVVVRMGDRPNSDSEGNEITTIFNNNIWKHLNEIIGKPSDVKDFQKKANPIIPEIVTNEIIAPLADSNSVGIKIFDLLGNCIFQGNPLVGNHSLIEFSKYPAGFYIFQIGNKFQKVIKLEK